MNSRTLLKTTASAVALTAGCGIASTAFANQSVHAHIAAGDVVMPSITYNGWNYSPFDQITTENVGNLTIAWTLQLGVLDQWEASPLVVGNTMYVASPVNQSVGTNQVPNVLIAIDVETQRILWEFRPDVDREQSLLACCGAQTRGLNYADGKVFYTTIDGQAFAIDGETGEALWRTLTTDVTILEHAASNAIVIGDLYITGNQGGEFGVRGKVTAININSGQTQWVMYSMGPDNEVGIGPRFNTFYADDQQGALSNWYGDSWRRGGGTSWGYFTYDPDLDLFHYSTGNCGPWNPDYRREWGTLTLDERGGLVDYRNNWCASQIARDAVTGEVIWAYNIVPADNWDLDQPLITPLVDLEINGQTRQTAIKAARNGYFYVWDRGTGELLLEPWPFVYVDFMTGVDMETGRALYDITRWNFTHVEDRRRYTDYNMPGAANRDDYTGTEINWCPGIAARNWQQDAWSPQTGLLYTPTSLGCATQVVVEGEYVAGDGAGYRLRRAAGTYPGGGARDPDRTSPTFGQPVNYNGQIQANNPVTSETVWTINWAPNNNVSIMATAGGLLFQGGSNRGEMRAFSAATGEQLWAFRVGSQFSQSPISYIGPDGRQYIAIIASSASTGQVTVNTAETAAARYARAGTTLYVFALPQAVAGN